jgi:isopenicillin-N epimerase
MFDSEAAELRRLFLIRDDVTFLNHGSFGACPRPVFERYQWWQREAETQPVEFHVRRAPILLEAARATLGRYLNADADDIVYVTNATVGVNIVARSLDLGPGDEILAGNHEYGACVRTWRFLCQQTGAHYRQFDIPVPVTSREDIVERFLAEVTPATRVIFLSHITAPTACILPVEEICRRARALGIITVVDGAHAPGQIEIDLERIGADFYTGNLHKWLCAPKGAAFLHARRELQPVLKPLVVSWGEELAFPSSSDFINQHQYRGTREISAPLSVPDAIAFQQEHDWPSVRLRCHQMISHARPIICDLLGATPITPDSPEWYAQMCAFLLPDEIDGALLKSLLYEQYRIEIPVFAWNGRETLRVSVQGYNGWSDLERLFDAVASLRPQVGREGR